MSRKNEVTHFPPPVATANAHTAVLDGYTRLFREFTADNSITLIAPASGERIRLPNDFVHMQKDARFDPLFLLLQQSRVQGAKIISNCAAYKEALGVFREYLLSLGFSAKQAELLRNHFVTASQAFRQELERRHVNRSSLGALPLDSDRTQFHCFIFVVDERLYVQLENAGRIFAKDMDPKKGTSIELPIDDSVAVLQRYIQAGPVDEKYDFRLKQRAIAAGIGTDQATLNDRLNRALNELWMDTCTEFSDVNDPVRDSVDFFIQSAKQVHLDTCLNPPLQERMARRNIAVADQLCDYVKFGTEVKKHECRSTIKQQYIHKDIRRRRIVSGIAIAAGLIALAVGAAAVPFTLGASLGLVIGAGILLGAGACMTGVSGTYSFFHERRPRTRMTKAANDVVNTLKERHKVDLTVKGHTAKTKAALEPDYEVLECQLDTDTDSYSSDESSGFIRLPNA